MSGEVGTRIPELHDSFRFLGGVMSKRKFSAVVIFVFLCFALITVPAYGYADPNTVGLLSQVLTPLLITAGACVTFLRKSILNAFSGLWQRLRGRSGE